MALLVVHGTLAWWTRPPGVMTGQDDAAYLLLARSLTRLGYQNIYLSGEPPHGLYPPGYPALLAVWGSIAGWGFDAAVLLSIAASVAALALAWAAARRMLPVGLALALLAALAVNPYLVAKAGEVASEAPFMALSLAALWLLGRGRNPATSTLVLVGALAVAATLTRAVGVTLIAALIAHWLLERRWVAAGSLGVAGLATLGPWLWWASTAPGRSAGKSYIADAVYRDPGEVPASLLEVLGERLVNNVPLYLTTSLPFRLPIPTIPGTRIDNAAGALIAAAGLAVGLATLWRRWPSAALYVLAYLSLLAVWPWQSGRFLVPLLPLVVPAVAVGVMRMTRLARPRWSVPVAIAFTLVLFVNGLVRTADAAVVRAACDRDASRPTAECLSPDQASFFEGMSYIERHVPQGAVVLTAKAEPLFYYTGRRSIAIDRRMAQGGDFVTALREAGVDYVLLGSLQAAEGDWLGEVLADSCEGLRLTASFPPRTYLFEVPGPASPASGANACAAMEEHRRLNRGRTFGAAE